MVDSSDLSLHDSSDYRSPPPKVTIRSHDSDKTEIGDGKNPNTMRFLSRVTEQARRSLALEAPLSALTRHLGIGKNSHNGGWIVPIVESVQFKFAIAFCIMSSMCLAVYETDKGAMNEDTDVWFQYCMGLLTLIYTSEIVLRVYAFRCVFFHDSMNVFELLVVVVDVCFFGYENITGNDGQKLFILRVCRLVRIARIVRLLSLFRPLFLILHGFFAAMQAIIWATVLLLVMIGLWSILAVDVLHPINQRVTRHDACERCGRAFESVFASCLSFLETTLAGETWGELSIPIIEDSPWTIFIFLGVHITVNMGIMNLILAVIVDQANQARAEDHEQILLEKQQAYLKAKNGLYRLCEEMDVDQSGTLTAAELLRGVSNIPDFASVLKLMDVRVEDIDVIFKILDADKSGDIDYNEFVEQVHRMKSQDGHSLLVFIKHYVLEVRERIEHQITMLQEVMHAEDLTIKDMLRDLLVNLRVSGNLSRSSDVSSHLARSVNSALEVHFDLASANPRPETCQWESVEADAAIKIQHPKASLPFEWEPLMSNLRQVQQETTRSLRDLDVSSKKHLIEAVPDRDGKRRVTPQQIPPLCLKGLSGSPDLRARVSPLGREPSSDSEGESLGCSNDPRVFNEKRPAAVARDRAAVDTERRMVL